jgi:hypothetical protein
MGACCNNDTREGNFECQDMELKDTKLDKEYEIGERAGRTVEVPLAEDNENDLTYKLNASKMKSSSDEINVFRV